MWRTSLSLLLIGSTLLGQSVCCCTLATLASSFCSKQTAESSCCCAASGTSEGKCPRRSDESDHQCPCQKGKVVSAILGDNLIVIPAQLIDWSRLFIPSVNFTSRLPMVVVTPMIMYSDSSAFPHLDRAGILRAVNSMRC